MGARRVVVATAGAPVAALVEEYREYLVGERGMAASTVRYYGRNAEDFLAGLAHPLRASLAGLTAGEVSSYVVAYAHGPNARSTRTVVTALRSLLRFLHLTGRIPIALAGGVPTVAGWRGSALPKVLAFEQVEALIASCDIANGTGRRDRAIMLVLARLGLRTCEVAALRLEDLDWRAGRVRIHGKGAQVDDLPLPASVGQALVAYLVADGSRDGCRFVFRTVRGRPRRGLTPTAVRGVVAAACTRAGLPRLAAHRLSPDPPSRFLLVGE